MANKVRLGFVPLVDCAIPVVARAMGFAQQENIDLELVREMSWAAIRDKLSFGMFEAAHLLAGIPIAARLGLGGLPVQNIVVPMALGRGGNAITVSTQLYQRMLEADPNAMLGPRGRSARALKKVIDEDKAEGRPILSFATVFPFSSHNYELRYWMAAAGIDPDMDVNIGVIAPPRMFDSLRNGWVDGYCVGEPWNQRAVFHGDGVIVALKDDIWSRSPEKVLGLREDWAQSNPELVSALVRALVRAAEWADQPGSRVELAHILSEEANVGAPFEVLKASLSGKPVLRPGEPPIDLPDRHVFYRYTATFPWLSQGRWIGEQMKRWRQLPQDTDLKAVIPDVFRPDLYRTAVAGLDVLVPQDDWRVEGAADAPDRSLVGMDQFLDDTIFKAEF
ncbi:MAG: ABC transporter substrate-binding protein [Thalassospira sp.]|uniref:CmpA/NrtA family ABC transporter substrate-binding protein n=1 Tax=Thalassospira sp. TaxID=1912094 RepID=UPI001B204E68|nr:CmpA/NrtA family ABC transporter substrate-binding protein [Thalassospira sp.]MBO6578678.1 ABC transporter substrate-binding protein [Thalassospira sp.]MBO6803933.1 ABC transporter substrate-binding protein [Thalassospira sp.]MBO6817047.1 ABC transporter substrate-binding protein [Thalassospira sp.]MBO6887030.1 ABC transporter substrate-binding protein [Thalassospira sp.]